MNISSRDNAMPVFLLRNCADHLSGCLRTIGAVAVGQLGRSGPEPSLGRRLETDSTHVDGNSERQVAWRVLGSQDGES